MGFNIVTSSGASGVSSAVSGVVSGFKPSIVLADFKAGTRSVTLPAGTYRVACVGGGGETNGTPGLGVGGTTSWAATHSATGGAAGAAGGTGVGGDINTSGGSTAAATVFTGGAAGGHRLGNSPDSVGPATGGGGWSSRGRDGHGGLGLVDGFGLGLPPGSVQLYSNGIPAAQPGCGAGLLVGNLSGIGGGGCGGSVATTAQNFGGPGGGGAGGQAAAYPGSGGGYSEKVITVASPASFSYTVGAGGGTYGGVGCVIVERL